MKTPIIVGLIGTGIFLTACETRVVEHDHNHQGYGYHDNGSSGYADAQYRDRTYVTDDRTRNVERTNVNVNETNVNRTVVNKTNVNRTTVNQNSKQSPHTGGHPTPQPAQVAKKGQVKNAKDQDKKKDNGQPQ